MILLNNFTMLGTILSPAYLKCSAVSVFDVVHHMLLLEKLYYEVPPEIWKVIQDLYSDMSSQVKWNGYTST
jgi:hypothetical protein